MEIDDGKPGVFPARHEPFPLSLHAHERNKAALFLSLSKQRK